MRKVIFAVIALLLFVQCNQKGEKRDFFNDSKGYPDFESSKGQLPLFAFDSLRIDSLSTSIDGKEYWYLSTASNALFNINGYIRSSEKVVYIKPGEKTESKINKEQVLFDFSCDTTKSWVVKYERSKVVQNLTMIENACFYNKQIRDSAVIFKAYREIQNTSFSEEFLVQVSLKKGIVSFKYLVRPEKKLYTIDYLPTPKITYDTVWVELHQVQ